MFVLSSFCTVALGFFFPIDAYLQKNVTRGIVVVSYVHACIENLILKFLLPSLCTVLSECHSVLFRLYVCASQMSLLRTVAAFSEKTSGDATHHRLLLRYFCSRLRTNNFR